MKTEFDSSEVLEKQKLSAESAGLIWLPKNTKNCIKAQGEATN